MCQRHDPGGQPGPRATLSTISTAAAAGIDTSSDTLVTQANSAGTPGALGFDVTEAGGSDTVTVSGVHFAHAALQETYSATCWWYQIDLAASAGSCAMRDYSALGATRPLVSFSVSSRTRPSALGSSTPACFASS